MHPFDSKNKRYKYLSTIERFQVAFSNRNRQKLRYNYGREYGKNDKGWNLPEQKPQDNAVFMKGAEEIDGIVAAIMALDRAQRNEGPSSGSVYDERGLLVL